MQPHTQPTLGRIVHFITDTGAAAKLNTLANFGGKHYGAGEIVPGMITRTLDNNAVNLTLFPDAQAVVHLQNVPFSTGKQEGTWNYPEKVGELAAA